MKNMFIFLPHGCYMSLSFTSFAIQPSQSPSYSILHYHSAGVSLTVTNWTCIYEMPTLNISGARSLHSV